MLRARNDIKYRRKVMRLVIDNGAQHKEEDSKRVIEINEKKWRKWKQLDRKYQLSNSAHRKYHQKNKQINEKYMKNAMRSRYRGKK